MGYEWGRQISFAVDSRALPPPSLCRVSTQMRADTGVEPRTWIMEQNQAQSPERRLIVENRGVCCSWPGWRKGLCDVENSPLLCTVQTKSSYPIDT
jgi:hypothetical protein